MATPTLYAFADASASASPFPSASSSSQPTSNPSSFYKNLFYILIGLLAAFGALSFFSLLRARRRRRIVVNEAERLGVVVPGVPGYVPMRERAVLLRWGGKDGPGVPLMWDAVPATADAAAPAMDVRAGEWDKVGVGVRVGEMDDCGGGARASLAPSGEPTPAAPFADVTPTLCPLAVVPPAPPAPILDPVPISPIPFFPNHLAYRAESLDPPRPAVNPADPETWQRLAGGTVEVVVVVRMPREGDLAGPGGAGGAGGRRPPVPSGEDDDAVAEQWGGVELGVARLQVAKSARDDL